MVANMTPTGDLNAGNRMKRENCHSTARKRAGVHITKNVAASGPLVEGEPGCVIVQASRLWPRLTCRLQEVGLIELTHPLVDLLAVNANLRRGRDADAHLVPFHRGDDHPNAAVD